MLLSGSIAGFQGGNRTLAKGREKMVFHAPEKNGGIVRRPSFGHAGVPIERNRLKG